MINNRFAMIATMFKDFLDYLGKRKWQGRIWVTIMSISIGFGILGSILMIALVMIKLNWL